MIKPRDLVRTPSGQTATVIAILPNGERELFLENGVYLTMRASLLYLVRAATPRRWPEHVTR